MILYSIPLDGLFTEGSIPATIYNVVKDEEYRGEIKVGLTFTPEVLRFQKLLYVRHLKQIHERVAIVRIIF